MGAGRRMSRKQGPPEALSEAHYARLKRKAGLPAEAPAESGDKKRRRTAKKAEAKAATGSKTATKKPMAKKPTAKSNGKAAGKAALLSDSSDETGDESLPLGGGDAFSDDDEAGGLGDDFLGSDSDPSVLDSDEAPPDGKHTFSEDEDESDAELKLSAANIEGLSRKLDRQRAEEAAANAAELAESALRTNIEGDRPRILGPAEGGSEAEDGPDGLAAAPGLALLAPDLQLLRTRITDTIRVLDDFAALAEEGRSRADYRAQLLKDVCAYYGYSELLADKLLHLFPPREAFAFFEANESPRPVVIRTNTLRTHRRDLAQALINRGVTLEPVGKWSKVGLQVFESAVPLGATPEYLAGHYILQAASSFLPCIALGPEENERVLDMAAAPGGKTTYMAAMMKNTGLIVANDASKARAKGLIGNIHRLGARNVIVANLDARTFPKPMGGFDRVLLDAPCSGTGVIAKDPSVKTNKTEADFIQLPHTQKQLLLAAIDSVNHASKTGGYLVYSTCSVTVEENEQVVQYALRRRPNVKLVDAGLAFGRPGFTSFRGKRFDPSMSLARRFYPHAYNVDGFFLAKFKKTGPSQPTAPAPADDAAAAPPTPDAPASKSSAPSAAIGHDPPESLSQPPPADDFGGWDDEADREYMQRARRNAMRRRGLDPRSKKPAKQPSSETNGSRPT